MYVDFSLKKFLLIALIAGGMYVCISLTVTLKERRYGSTPPFAAIGLAWQEITLRSFYGIAGIIRKVGMTASAGLAAIGFADTSSEGRPARAIPILTYHRIVGAQNDLNNVTARNFRDQMFTLKRAGWETITLKQYQAFMRGELDLPERSVLITFDDGAKESLYPVDPLFAALDYEGVMFIIANSAHTPESTYYLSPTEIVRMLKSGRWEIGSHSFDGHRPYPADANGTEGIFFADKLWRTENRIETTLEFTERVRDDLSRARASLEQEYGAVVDTFAFPLGNETGIAGAANFPAGASITEDIASEIYSIGFLQTSNGQFTYNYPEYRSFVARRIHVDHDWDGERLLHELERGLPKDTPFQDDFSDDRGWIPAWGELSLGRNNFSLHAAPNASSASAVLDGTALWTDYSLDATGRWHSGFVSLLADLTDARTYNSCAFGDGVVRLQRTDDGHTTVRAERKDDRITYSDAAHFGMRVHGSVIECTWNYASVLETYDRTGMGGIGVQVWQPELGKANVQLSEVLVRPYAENS